MTDKMTLMRIWEILHCHTTHTPHIYKTLKALKAHAEKIECRCPEGGPGKLIRLRLYCPYCGKKRTPRS